MMEREGASMSVRKPAATRLLCTEPLEGRWLLSAPAAPVVAEAAADERVTHTAALEVSAEDDERDDEADDLGAPADDEPDDAGERLTKVPTLSPVTAAP